MTAKTFRAVIQRKLESLGYIKVWGKTWGTVCLMYKPVDSFILCLGVETSRLYKSRFTASFYISRSFRWSYMGIGFPRIAYQRIGRFLETAQRLALLDNQHSQPGVVDAWWDWSREGDLEKFEAALLIAEPRFLAQANLFELLSNSEAVARSETLVSALLTELGETIDVSKPDCLMDNLKNAAMKVLRATQPDFANKELAESLATDAFRCLFHGVKQGERQHGAVGYSLTK